MLGYYLTPAKAKNFVLLAGSLVFYTCGEPLVCPASGNVRPVEFLFGKDD